MSGSKHIYKKQKLRKPKKKTTSPYALLEAALEKMGITLLYDSTTYKCDALISHSGYFVVCYDVDGWPMSIPDSIEKLSKVKYLVKYFDFGEFDSGEPNNRDRIDNLFFGIKNEDELKVHLDLV